MVVVYLSAREYVFRSMLYELFHYVHVILRCNWMIGLDTDAYGVPS